MITFFAENPVAAVIVACEVGLWVLLGLGMVSALPMARLRRTSTVVLAGIPLLDLAAGHRHGDRPAQWRRGGLCTRVGRVLPRLEPGFRACHSCGGPTFGSLTGSPAVPAPQKAPKHGPERVAHLMREWYRVLGTVAIASGGAGRCLILFFAAPEDQAGLWWWIGRAWVVVGLWFVFGPLWESGKSALSPQTEPEPVGGVADDAELLGDLDRGGAAAGVAGVHRPVDGEHIAHLRR